MKKWKIRFLSPVILLAGLLLDINICDAFTAPKNTLFAGTAKIMITPGTPIPMSGYGGRTAPFKGVHDDLFARVIVFSDGVNKAVLISADVIGFSNSFWEEITQHITGKASDLDHSWPDHIDHQKPELSACCLIMYVNYNLTGQLWSIRPAFAANEKINRFTFCF